MAKGSKSQDARNMNRFTHNGKPPESGTKGKAAVVMVIGPTGKRRMKKVSGA